MLIAVIIVASVVVLLAGAWALLRLRGGRGSRGNAALPPSDPHTHARDNTDPATAIDQLRSQGNAGGTGGAF